MTTHDKPQESTDPEPRQFEGVELTMGPKRWPSSIDIGRESLESEMKATGKQLRRHMFLYLWLNQAAYAIVALPIGIVLSIAPLFLNHQLGVSVPVIGLFMTGGELLGVLAMWAAERAKSGFILRRPHDIHLIIFSVASFVALIPVWPKAVWYFAATCMMAVQALNSASKPVVGEAIHRMAMLMRKQPSLVFAQANMWRRVGNAIVGSTSPLVFAASPISPFYIPWPILVALVVTMLIHSLRINQASEACSDALRSINPGAGLQPSTLRRGKSTISNLMRTQEAVTAMQTARAQNAWYRFTTRLWQRRSGTPWRTRSPAPAREVHGPTGKEPEVVSARGKPPPLLRFLVVHLFPFCDAALSRLPFAFLTIAIASSSSILLASAVLCAYQLARAISQCVQTKKCDTSLNYAACTMAVVLYFSLIVYLETSTDPTLWYIPITITGVAETLAVQQYFLVCMYSQAKGETIEPDDPQVRRAVKASHTGTGLGSALAFITSSQTYELHGLRGVAYLGLAIAVLKCATSIAIGMALPRSGRCTSTSKI